VSACARTIPVLEWRREVGDPRYLDELAARAGSEGALLRNAT
jgi:hypothetical protein